MDWLITGDTHGKNFERVKRAQKINPNAALIILGDAGFNFYLNKTDNRGKEKVCFLGMPVYCVRGNHEERPENLPSMQKIFDPKVMNEVYYEPQYPLIRYFIDGYTYNLNGKLAVVLGGAYSIDKEWRLSQVSADASWTGWFKDEQLNEKERTVISNKINGYTFDYVFSHTCPYEWMPRDLFINTTATPDYSMEWWLSDIEKQIKYKHWYFGHFHADREYLKATMLFTSIVPLRE